jgi:ribosomal protein L21
MDDKRKSFFEDIDSQKPSFEADPDFFKRQEEKHRRFFEEDTNDKDDDGDPSFFSSFLLTREQVIEQVKNDGLFLEKVSAKYGDDIEIVSLAVENNANAYTFASKKLRADDETAEILRFEKEAKIEETKRQHRADPTVLALLQEQIDTINSIHFQAKQEKNSQENWQHISM